MLRTQYQRFARKKSRLRDQTQGGSLCPATNTGRNLSLKRDRLTWRTGLRRVLGRLSGLPGRGDRGHGLSWVHGRGILILRGLAILGSIHRRRIGLLWGLRRNRLSIRGRIGIGAGLLHGLIGILHRSRPGPHFAVNPVGKRGEQREISLTVLGDAKDTQNTQDKRRQIH